MLDIHSHILPNMDDGSDSIETSRGILKMLREQGVTQVAATPHFYASKDNPEDFLRRRRESLEKLGCTEESTPHILPGAEVAYFDSMSRCQELKEMEIGNTGLLLVEMPFADWNNRMIEELYRIPVELGLTPLLAHVERYPGKKQLRKYLSELISQGVAMQCNAEAFLSIRRRHWVISMVRQGYVHFLGTDTHNLTTRAPRYAEAVQVLQKKLDPQIVDSIINPI